jgi:hypothetical protein
MVPKEWRYRCPGQKPCWSATSMAPLKGTNPERTVPLAEHSKWPRQAPFGVSSEREKKGTRAGDGAQSRAGRCPG